MNSPKKLLENTTTMSHFSTDDDDDVVYTAVPDNRHICLGAISLRRQQQQDSESQVVMCSPTRTEPYPNQLLSSAIRRGWIHLEEHRAPSSDAHSFFRVYVLPEDVDRGNRGTFKDFRKTIKFLLGFVNRAHHAWLGQAGAVEDFVTYDVPKSTQGESLFYIFNTLRSPCPDLDCFQTSAYGYRSVRDVMNGTVPGLKTALYSYQTRSVSVMIQRETEPAKILDPRKSIFQDLHGRSFYLDVHDGVLLRNPPLYNEPQGGILAETMGYGKTLICIALILATKGHYPKIPSDRIDSIPYQPREKVGSLLAMAARRTKHEGVPWKGDFYALKRASYQYDNCLAELEKYDREYAEPIFTPTTPNRKGKRESANIIRLCSATLIIVPPNLLVQWEHEIAKHTENGALDVLVVDSPKVPLPAWKELLKYDIVLMTKARFEQEYRDDDLNQGKTQRGDARYRSPLTDVRWLRVICDEGHAFAGSSSRTNSMAMLNKMFIERRWVVSGTPSSTLHGVEIDLAASKPTRISGAHRTNSDSLVPELTRSESLDQTLQKRRQPVALEQEAKDLERLRLIVINFLHLQPWANQRGSSDVANWKRYLTTSTASNHFASPALREVLQTLIIRHRIEDIDTDLTLPPLHNRIVYLTPSYHDKLSINMFLLVLASNFVTSEREDEDYMFHPRNRKKLDLLINNLRQASFHWVGFSEHDIKETLKICDDYFNRHIDTISDADGLLLTEAVMNGDRALNDPSWRAFANLHEIGVYIQDFPEHAREAWALDGQDNNPLLLGTVQAREAQRHVSEQHIKGCDDVLLSGLAGAGLKAMKAARTRAEDEKKAQQHAASRVSDNEKKHLGTAEEPKLRMGSSSLSSVSKSPTRLNNSSPLSMRKRRRSSEGSGPSLLTPPLSPSSSQETVPVPAADSVTSNTRVASFTSSKLNYLISKLFNLPSGTKSLVFYQHNNTAFFIAEALELLGVPFLIYANTLSVAQRNAYLAEFNTDISNIRVLLMDIKQASHGLHVACASYVCIVSPIWDASVESQAIKRAHRIGQNKEVIVETLVLKGTFEEEMVQRRTWKDEHRDLDLAADQRPPSAVFHASSKDDFLQTDMTGSRRTSGRLPATGKSLLDDRHMVAVIKDIRFMKFTAEERLNGAQVHEMDVSIDQRRLFKNSAASKVREEVLMTG